MKATIPFTRFGLHLSLALASAVVSVAAAAQSMAHEEHHMHDAGGMQETATQTPSEAMTAGEVRKVAKDTGKLTIRHEELKNLGMPAMTMVFRVKDPTLLDQVKAGDKIHFVAEKEGSQLVVTQLEVAR